MTKDEQVWNEFMGEDDFDSLSIHNKSLIKGIMSSYAKQQAIAFMKHCIEFSILSATTDETVCLDGYEYDHNSFEEVAMARYDQCVANQFIEQQNKEK
jgi:hypothetical protein